MKWKVVFGKICMLYIVKVGCCVDVIHSYVIVAEKTTGNVIEKYKSACREMV